MAFVSNCVDMISFAYYVKNDNLLGDGQNYIVIYSVLNFTSIHIEYSSGEFIVVTISNEGNLRS